MLSWYYRKIRRCPHPTSLQVRYWPVISKLVLSHYYLLNEYLNYFLNRNQEGHLHAKLLNVEQLYLVYFNSCTTQGEGHRNTMGMTPTSIPYIMFCYNLCYFPQLFTTCTVFASYTNHVCQTCNIITLLQWDFTLYFITNQNHFHKTTQTKSLRSQAECHITDLLTSDLSSPNCKY